MKIAARKDLEAHRSGAFALIDAHAEAARLEGISATQAMLYNFKTAEAKLVLTGDMRNAHEDDYPFLAAEIGTTHDTLVGVATAVMRQHMTWQQKMIAIEQRRVAAKKAVRATSDVAEMSRIAESMLKPENDTAS